MVNEFLLIFPHFEKILIGPAMIFGEMVTGGHYIETHNEPIDIYGEVPNFYSDIETWKSEIKNMSPTKFIKLQQRHTQIGNIIKTQVMKKI